MGIVKAKNNDVGVTWIIVVTSIISVKVVCKDYHSPGSNERIKISTVIKGIHNIFQYENKGIMIHLNFDGHKVTENANGGPSFG